MLNSRRNPRHVYLNHETVRAIANNIVSTLIESYNDFIKKNHYDIHYNNVSEVEVFRRSYYAFDTYLDGSTAEPVQIRVVLKSVHGEVNDIHGEMDKDSKLISLILITGDKLKDNESAIFNRLSRARETIENYIFIILLHELTHARESQVSLSRNRNKYELDENGNPLNLYRYYNSPVEVAAYINTIIAQIEDSDSSRAIWNHYFEERDVTGYINAISSAFHDDFLGVFSEKNKRKVTLAILNYLEQSNTRQNPSEENIITLSVCPEGISLKKPMPVYHATIGLEGILSSGKLLTRKELGGNVNAIGGGPDSSISLTGDLQVAIACGLALVTTAKIANGMITAEDIMLEAKVKCPGGLEGALTSYPVWKNRSPLEADTYDIFNLYRTILFSAQFRHECYDPALFDTRLELFENYAKTIKNIAVLKTALSCESFIVPSYTNFRVLGSLNSVEFSVSEWGIRSGSRATGVSQRFIYDKTFTVVSDSGCRVNFDNTFEPPLGLPPYKTNVSYLPSMNEYRAWNSNILKPIDKESVLIQGEEFVKVSKGVGGGEFFYPYFTQKTILDNILESQK